MKRNAATAEAQARVARLAERRDEEEELLTAAADALALIDRTITSLDLAVDLANEKLQEATEQLQRSIQALGKFGYRAADVATILGVQPADLRPRIRVSLRRTSRRSPLPRGGEVEGNGQAPPGAGAAPANGADGGASKTTE